MALAPYRYDRAFAVGGPFFGVVSVQRLLGLV